MKCLLKVVVTLVMLPILFTLIFPLGFLSIVLILAGCRDAGNTPVDHVLDWVDEWKKL